MHTKIQPLITGKIDGRKHMHLKSAFTVVLDSGGTDCYAYAAVKKSETTMCFYTKYFIVNYQYWF